MTELTGTCSFDRLERRAELEGRTKKEDSRVKAEVGTNDSADSPAPAESASSALANTLFQPDSPAPESVNGNGHVNGGQRSPVGPPHSAAPSEVAMSDPGRDAAGPEAKGEASVEGEVDEDEDQLADDDGVSEMGASEAGSLASWSHHAVPGKSLSASKLRAEARLMKLSQREIDKVQHDIDDALRTLVKTEDRVEREFRRFKNVARCLPLGRDRFHCRYWWFDGVGAMNLVGGPSGASIQYNTGRLLIQGPSQEDWDLLCGLHGQDAIQARRKREEVEDGAILAVNEWAYFDSEQQLEQLETWLNPKGLRELALRNALAKWKAYIVAGARKRQHDAAAAAEDSSGRRSTRRGGEVLPEGYLGWRNKIAKA